MSIYYNLYTAILKASSETILSWPQGPNIPFFTIKQTRKSKTNPQCLVITSYSVTPWTADPEIPVLYFSVTRVPDTTTDDNNTYTDDDTDCNSIDLNTLPQDTFLTDPEDIIAELVPEPYADEINKTLPALSQGIHPYTGLPVFFLHPCATQDLLKIIESPDPVLTMYRWLQTFGRVVSLDIPEYVP
ncbi:uncharacterized protein SAPINGB_P003757 [Magnusiomyces paraingens]|uniref:Ubiquitin-like-conjugating enzyme ATG10 n=1 Tax=Magnusiomyces paraingens TaxID=2606893 RepID=A0A5E8BR31_9ASCO|nr:uncharacterized protein SAPINGB_P003757 [Saprochaete ingens]VVT53803.1 unnamed protein product [Saprochaete ingens]